MRSITNASGASQHAHLQLPQRRNRPLPKREPQSLPVAEQANARWSLDFVSDALTDGRRFRVLNVLDDFSRRLLGQEIDFSLPARRVIQLLERLVETHGRPQQLRCDNGPEFIAHELRHWCAQQQVRLHWIEPGKPMQNAFIGRFYRSFAAKHLTPNSFLRCATCVSAAPTGSTTTTICGPARRPTS